MARLLGVFTFKRFIYYCFPIYLVFAEYAIRFLLSFVPGKSEDLSVVSTSSTVMAAGLSLIAAVLIPKPLELDAELRTALQARGAHPVGNLDHKLIQFAYLALLLLPGAWGAALWMVHTGNRDYDVHISNTTLPGPFLVGCAVYVIGLILTEVKVIA